MIVPIDFHISQRSRSTTNQISIGHMIKFWQDFLKAVIPGIKSQKTTPWLLSWYYPRTSSTPLPNLKHQFTIILGKFHHDLNQRPHQADDVCFFSFFKGNHPWIMAARFKLVNYSSFPRYPPLMDLWYIHIFIDHHSPSLTIINPFQQTIRSWTMRNPESSQWHVTYQDHPH